MKRKLLLGIIFILLTTSLFSVAKKPLFELFTSSTCPPCGNANPIMDAVLAENPEEYSLIKYQTNWPGNGDPYYISLTGERVSYYGINGVPNLFSNGEQYQVFDFTQGYLDLLSNETTDLIIDVTANIDDENLVSIETTLTAEQAYAEGLKLFISIVEKNTVGNVGSNFETDFHNVLMGMNENGTGLNLDAFEANGQFSLTETFDMNSTFMEQPNDLFAIVFVQNLSTGEVIQSEMVDVTGTFDDYNLSFNVSDSEGNLVEGAEIFLGEYGTSFSDENGLITYSGIFPGSYDYNIIKAGLFPVSGVADIVASDVNIDVIMEVPGDYFYEDFGADIPSDWTLHVTSPDYLYAFGGKVIIFRQNSAAPALMLVSPLIDFTPAETIFFDVGEASGGPLLSFGYLTDASDPSTFTLISELSPTESMTEHSFDLTSIIGSYNLAWRLDTTTMSFFSMDNVRITAGEVQGLNPPASMEVVLEDYNSAFIIWEAASVNRELIGYNLYRDDVLIYEHNLLGELNYLDSDLDAGFYSYSVSAVYSEGESEQIYDGLIITLNAPVELTVEIIAQDIQFNWLAPTVDREIVEYNIYLDDTEIGTTTEISFLYSDVVEAGAHVAGVSAIYSGGFESEIASVDFDYVSGNETDVENISLSIHNYPNPFNPTTTISFGLAEETNVNLEIFNLKGQKIKNLLNEVKEIGKHNVIWNGSDENGNSVSSGMYYYKITISEHTYVKKMILLK